MSLPPGFVARPMAHDLWDEAIRAAHADEPGTLIWDGSAGRCRAAIVFAPDRALDVGTLLDLGLLALFDATALLAPPKAPITIAPPNALMVDGGRVATLTSATAPGAIPEWAVLALDLAIDLQDHSPGDRPHQTCLAEEGFGAVVASDVLGAMARHLLVWIDTWREEGPAALARTVRQRTTPMALAG